MGSIYHLRDFSNPDIGLFEAVFILFLRVLAIVCGLLLLNKISWARWLAIVWLIYHVVISTFNSMSETVVHIIFLILVSVLLFLPVSTAFFRNKNAKL